MFDIPVGDEFVFVGGVDVDENVIVTVALFPFTVTDPVDLDIMYPDIDPMLYEYDPLG